MPQQEEFLRMARLVDDAADQVARGSTAGLNLLFAEMQALCAMMPGVRAAKAASGSVEAEAAARQREAEVESAFDNMPV